MSVEFRAIAEGDLFLKRGELLRIAQDAKDESGSREVLQLVVDRLNAGVVADAKVCMDVLAVLAERGSMRATYHLAVALLAFGKEQSEMAKAFNLFEKVIQEARRDEVRLVTMAQAHTGAMLASGVGCEQDLKEGLSRLLASSGKGCIEACLNAAILLDREGSDASSIKDAGMAVELYRKAAAAGSVGAAAALAWKLTHRMASEDFQGEALHWLTEAAKGGHPAAVQALEAVQASKSSAYSPVKIH